MSTNRRSISSRRSTFDDPTASYDQVFTRRDPGPDGILGSVDDGGVFTIYDYDPAFRGSNFVANMLVNASDRRDSFNNFELTVNKRSSNRWFAFTSLLATKYHQWLVLVPQSPNDDFFPLNDTWEISYRLAAGYELPFGVNLSTLYQAYQRHPRWQRTYLFRAADPDGGRAFPSSGTINVRMEPFGGPSWRQPPHRQPAWCQVLPGCAVTNSPWSSMRSTLSIRTSRGEGMSMRLDRGLTTSPARHSAM